MSKQNKATPKKAAKPLPAKAKKVRTQVRRQVRTPAPPPKAARRNGASQKKRASRPAQANRNASVRTSFLPGSKKQAAVDAKLTPFFRKQKERLLQLRDGMLDSMMGVAKDNLRSRAEGSEASAFGMHQADAGSDAYDRDFALSLLSQEQDALYEIDEALKRIDVGTYGICEMSGNPILRARLEAIPFARFTVDCQTQLEKQHKVTRSRQPVTSLFGLTDEEAADTEEEESPVDTKE